MAETLTKEEEAAVEAEVKRLQSEQEQADKVAELSAKFEELEKKYKQLEADKTKSEEEARTYAEQLATQQEELRVSSIQQWLDENQKKMTPIEQDFMAYMLDVLTLPPGSEVKAYAMEDENKKTVELAPAEVLMAMIETRPDDCFAHLYEELSQGGGTAGAGEAGKADEGIQDPKGEAISRAKKYAKEHGDMPLQKAYRIVLDEDPELKDAVAGVRPEGRDKAKDGEAVARKLYNKRS